MRYVSTFKSDTNYANSADSYTISYDESALNYLPNPSIASSGLLKCDLGNVVINSVTKSDRTITINFNVNNYPANKPTFFITINYSGDIVCANDCYVVPTLPYSSSYSVNDSKMQIFPKNYILKFNKWDEDLDNSVPLLVNTIHDNADVISNDSWIQELTSPYYNYKYSPVKIYKPGTRPTLTKLIAERDAYGALCIHKTTGGLEIYHKGSSTTSSDVPDIILNESDFYDNSIPDRLCVVIQAAGGGGGFGSVGAGGSSGSYADVILDISKEGYYYFWSGNGGTGGSSSNAQGGAGGNCYIYYSTSFVSTPTSMGSISKSTYLTLLGGNATSANGVTPANTSPLLGTGSSTYDSNYVYLIDRGYGYYGAIGGESSGEGTPGGSSSTTIMRASKSSVLSELYDVSPVYLSRTSYGKSGGLTYWGGGGAASRFNKGGDAGSDGTSPQGKHGKSGELGSGGGGGGNPSGNGGNGGDGYFRIYY